MRITGRDGNNLFIVAKVHTQTMHEHKVKTWTILSDDSNNDNNIYVAHLLCLSCSGLERWKSFCVVGNEQKAIGSRWHGSGEHETAS